jgi:hypothetical protein
MTCCSRHRTRGFRHRRFQGLRCPIGRCRRGLPSEAGALLRPSLSRRCSPRPQWRRRRPWLARPRRYHPSHDWHPAAKSRRPWSRPRRRPAPPPRHREPGSPRGSSCVRVAVYHGSERAAEDRHAAESRRPSVPSQRVRGAQIGGRFAEHASVEPGSCSAAKVGAERPVGLRTQRLALRRRERRSGAAGPFHRAVRPGAGPSLCFSASRRPNAHGPPRVSKRCILPG